MASKLLSPTATTVNPTGNARFLSAMEDIYPDLDKARTQSSSNILSELKGELSPETINAIQDEAARFGVTSGMPLSQLAGYKGLRSLGLSTEATQQQGLQDYLNTIKGYSGTLTPTTGEVLGREAATEAVQAAAERQSAQLASEEEMQRRLLAQQSDLEGKRLAEQQAEFGVTSSERAREFDIGQYLTNQYNYANLANQYLNTYLSMLS